MTTIPSNSAELQREFTHRASAVGLKIDCLGDGALDSEYIVIAEAPGENECRMKVPLIGGSGRVLWEAFKKIGINRTHCYTTNVYKRRVSESDNEKMNPNERAHWYGLLQWELQQLPKAKYVILCGAAALHAVLGHKDIDNWRGTCIEQLGKWYCCTYNPAHVMRKNELEVILQLDLGKLDMIRRGQWVEHNITAHYDLSPSEITRWLERFHDERQPVAFDIESSAGETACIGFANNPHEGICINWRTMEAPTFSVRDECLLRRQVAQFLGSETVRLVGQNANFDSYWLWYKDRIRVRKVWFDTLLAHHTLYPTLPHNLGFLTSQYTTHPYYKDERLTWREDGGNIGQYWTYNVKDCCITHAAHTRLARELELQQLSDFFHSHVMRLNPHCAAMTVYGMLVDAKMRSELNDILRRETDAVERDLIDTARRVLGVEDYSFNPRSRNQVADLLFTRLRLIGRGTSTDETNRKHMYNHPGTSQGAKEVLIAIDRYKEKHKFFSTYVETKLDGDNRFRAEWKQYGVAKAPGRLSSSGNMWGTASNFQNQPDAARGMFVADPGHSLVYFDLRQAEAKLVAYFANIVSWKHQFELALKEPKRYDVHRMLASDMWGIPYDDVPTKDVVDGKHSIRYTAKRCRHGLNYRMQPARLAETTGLTLVEATDAYYKYHRATPELRVWWKVLTEEVKSSRELYNALGRRLLFLGRIDDHNEEQLESIVAFKPQSTIGDHVCRVIYMTHEDARWPSTAHVLHNGHDSLTAMCREGDEMRCLSIMKEYAEMPIYIGGEPCIVPADCKMSVVDEHGMHRWDNMKEVEL